eukprot:CAMPEP_0118977238 /NCGR_PEP_ID=MMETSP1173-20130426/20861_1 /TAXON_ID=1034831 /ORGANISM="Rhizochromulina marina cf, Strain CCMP1243" /LENGTH=329 /DNA_ID=CAMNT_0006927319 /DNA_START=116 /DNA_END=1105 /DNA_ORIENTATION=-
MQVIYLSLCDLGFSSCNIITATLSEYAGVGISMCHVMSPLTFLFTLLSIAWAGALAVSAAISSHRQARRLRQLSESEQRMFHLLWPIIILANIPMFVYSGDGQVALSKTLGICHWRDSNEDGKYKHSYSTGYVLGNHIELGVVLIALAASVLAVAFIRLSFRHAPQVVRDRHSARIERYIIVFVFIWALRLFSNMATCKNGLYPGPSNITYWIWLAPGGWGLVNAMNLGTSRTAEAWEWFARVFTCDKSDENDIESLPSEHPGNSAHPDGSDSATSHSFSRFVIFRPSANQVKYIDDPLLSSSEGSSTSLGLSARFSAFLRSSNASASS